MKTWKQLQSEKKYNWDIEIVLFVLTMIGILGNFEINSLLK